MLNFHKKTFRSLSNTANGEVGEETLFHYSQNGDIVWAEYAGGMIVKGFLIAKVLADSILDMRYEHINKAGEIMTGKCCSTPELLPDGRIRLHEKWQWTSGDLSSGESVVEEIIN
ncbi:n-acetylglutamate synthase [Emticicia soli]|uniref:N-acetylglutamate synthase n=1 Tax=Emticicia soli TaxID=2027878 RepID=A0ABW5JFE7_9BACT